MSNSLAIAAATASVRNLLLRLIPLRDAELADLEVTTQPPDTARKGNTKAQLNLFLYQTVVNSAWRNMDMPRQVRPGEHGAPPLALNLHYLITAFGRGETDTDVVSHRVLGGAMSVLHDHMLLSPNDIRMAIADNDLAEQFERMRITPLSVNSEEMSRLWTTFQTPYRVSAGYEVTVILIDSRTPVRASLPVLRRGEADRGVIAVPAAIAVLRGIRYPRSQQAARLGENIILVGEQLGGADTVIRFTSLRLKDPLEFPLGTSGVAGEIDFHLPNPTEDPEALARWTPGFYIAALVVKRAGSPVIISNAVAFALAPQIKRSKNNAPVGTVISLTCEPRLVPGQQVLLLFGDRQLEPDSIASPADPIQASQLEFTVPGVEAAVYTLRLRVDGVDSNPMVYVGDPPVPSFNPEHQVTVT